MEFVLWLKEENESPDVGLIVSIGFGGNMKTDGHIAVFLIQRYHFQGTESSFLFHWFRCELSCCIHRNSEEKQMMDTLTW